MWVFLFKLIIIHNFLYQALVFFGARNKEHRYRSKVTPGSI